MGKTILRIQSIELEGFKNIQKGVIDLLSYKQKKYNISKADVIGIYGQNGSGKTAIVEAFKLFKTIASGNKLPDDIKNYIHQLEDTATLKFIFYIENDSEKFLVYYDFSLRRVDGKAELYNEKISYSIVSDDSKSRKIDIIEYTMDSKEVTISPKLRYSELIKSRKENEFDIEVCKRLSIKEKTSFIFNNSLEEIFKKHFKNIDFFNIITAIKHFAKMDLFVITNEHSATISLNFMALSFRMEDDVGVTSGDIPINLLGPSKVDKKNYDIVAQIIKQLNIVLCTIIPNLQLEIKNLGNELSQKGDVTTTIEFLSVKKDIRIPLKYESEGIKKIISILSTLVSMFNNPSICLIVDELDSGIFEYLLGELLKIIEQRGKGQFIFTSHNLRALEMLSKDSLVFSTANPKNRFMRLPLIKSNNNLRNVYLRGVDLGGLSECIYEETNSFEIAHAFRKAGDVCGEE